MAAQQRPATAGLADTVSSHVARLALDTAEQAGVPCSELAPLAKLIRMSAPDNRTRVPTTDMVRLWEILRQHVGPEAGVRMAALADPGSLHVWDYLIQAAPTMSESLRTAAAHTATICDPAVSMHVADDGSRLALAIADSPFGGPAVAAFTEFALAVTQRRIRESFGACAIPVRVDFTHAAPRDTGYLADAFGTGNIHFGQERAGMTFLPAADLRERPPHDPRLYGILQDYARHLIDHPLPAPSWPESVRTVIRFVVSGNTSRGIDMGEVAGRLNLSPRTFQRRLAEYGTSWRAELEAARHELALELLADPGIPVRTVALRLGYDDHRTLSRAFQRWTGLTPTEYRRATDPVDRGRPGTVVAASEPE
ncbi:helix-turn-helix transcriptional regulator [Nocardia seriolae]|uniref:AraC family transcriptional regulator n=1 Tax=Nocardia seriolae TaxID=37332 RepID=A0A0B8N1N4_9NOCA|nr:AraC family transcriptional regulator [Nocardia seriolae]APB00204.1 putative HTH-type transcriptional regulator [Nocardia seriolae]MTJ64881.1 helix-turn-helix domain-containing protein [Nocardia seriolae]MTJ70906.1 helix-turn-helix domain-containing protein [Nocardia seriolae]MTJ89697.1 helix-turn-helix domain-containing protein [Nocardia seriolae]MTK33672.1 helix-turn-helix domain-containing protein [Nocardia seriolae]